jgi:hypothetical protein
MKNGNKRRIRRKGMKDGIVDRLMCKRTRTLKVSGSDLPQGAQGADDYEWEEPPHDETMMDGDIRSRLTDMSDQEIQDLFNSRKHGVAGGNQGFEEYLQFVVGQLDELGMELSDVPRDGDCLSHAFHRARADSQPREVFSKQSRQAVDQLRQNVVEFLRGSLTDEDVTNIGLTLDHSAGDETEIISKDVYLRRLADPGVYMGQTEVKALSDMFQVGINLITGKVFQSMPGAHTGSSTCKRSLSSRFQASDHGRVAPIDD